MVRNSNKIYVDTAPPESSKRIIGGSNQRSVLQQRLQGSRGWKHNHAPVNLNQKNNLNWWKNSANRYDAPLSSSYNINNLYTNQAIKTQVQRNLDRERIYFFSADYNSSIKGGSNQTLNKKYHLGDKTIGSFDTELDITDLIYPNTKKRVTFGVTIDGITYNSEQAVPFSLFSSSVT
ncbi:MAG TPA: hypothetical protein DCX27_13630, partial [Balneola sp.]|nr:hypothetical protein [Balneola sp.]